MNIFKIVVAAFALTLSSPYVMAATQAQIDSAWHRGLAWLVLHQNGDGSWKGKESTEVIATTSAVQAMQKINLANFSYSKGLAWLGNTPIYSVDSLTRKINTLYTAKVNVTPDLAQLVAWRNRRIVWGAYDHYETSYPDTAFALSAIINAKYTYSSTNITRALCEIIQAQKTGTGDMTIEGSWSYTNKITGAPAARGAILPTVGNLLALNDAKVKKAIASVTCNSIVYSLQSSINAGLSWLISQKYNTLEGGFGTDGSSTVLYTALVYEALSILLPADVTTQSALNYLILHQTADGSWNGDPIQTAYALKVLPIPTSMIDTDKDGLPDKVESYLSTNPLVADARTLEKTNGNGSLAATAFNQTGVQNRGFDYAISASGGTKPYTWALSAGVLPAGLTLNSTTGHIIGTPTETGSFTVVLSITDSRYIAMKVAGQIKISAYAGNLAPVAVADSATMLINTAIVLNVLANDVDADGDIMSVSSVTQGAKGTVMINMDQTVTYAPNTNYTGTDSFTYTLNDGNGGTALGTVTVMVKLSNYPPVANNDFTSTPEDTGVNINVLSNDTDVNGDVLSISGVTQGLHGGVSNMGSYVTYIPAMNYNGSDGFNYTVSDSNGGSTTGAVTVTILPVNDAPMAANPGAQTHKAKSVVSLQITASDVDGNVLTYSATGLPPGLSINSTSGLITGTLQTISVGKYNTRVTVTDGALPVAADFLWEIRSADDSLVPIVYLLILSP